MVRKALFMIVVMFGLAACAGNPLTTYANIPTTCEAINTEQLRLAKRIMTIASLHTTKKIGIGALGIGVALGTFPPAAALIGPVLGNININTTPDRDRITHLAIVSEIRECN